MLIMDDVKELEQVVLTDDEGNEAVCLVLARLEVGGNEYVVVVDEAGTDVADEEAGTAGILRVEREEGDEQEQWVTVEDDEEWEQVAEAWALLIGVEDEEDHEDEDQ